VLLRRKFEDVCRRVSSNWQIFKLKKYGINIPLNVLRIIRHFNKKTFLAMKKLLLLFSFFFLLLIIAGKSMGQVTNPGTVVKTDASNQTNNNINTGVNNGLNNVANGVKGLFKKKQKPAPVDTAKHAQVAANNGQTAMTAGQSAAANPAFSGSMASYQNYDFVPGTTVLFEDEFTDDESGEFPTHWNLSGGQAILNMAGPDKAFFLTDGNYVHVSPLMKNKSYLTANCSVEYDYYGNDSYAPIIAMIGSDTHSDLEVQVTGGSVNWSAYVASIGHGYNLGAALPADIGGNNFSNKWHHIAIAFRNGQMKVYVDKYRVLIAPNCYGVQPAYIDVKGIGSQEKPIIFKNFKVCDGIQFYMTGQKFTDAKLVTHGINFDVDKATLRPESMGTLNLVIKIMKDNPDLKFEVDGHTDNTGTPAHNLLLSQQRSQAVMAQLIVMGIDASRLTSKGFGDTKPITDNTTLEGKANNRRVEFVKQ
jgi:OOP family OmpA-OmpF porin